MVPPLIYHSDGYTDTTFGKTLLHLPSCEVFSGEPAIYLQFSSHLLIVS